LEELGADGSIMLKWILKKQEGVMEWIDLAKVGKGGRLL